MNYKIVAERMQKIKREKGIFFEDIDKITGIRPCRVTRIMCGKSAPRLSEFALLCLALGASADDLLRADDKWEIIER